MNGREERVWTYLDLFLFIGLGSAALIPAAFVLPLLKPVMPSLGQRGLVAQFVWYLLMIGALYLLFRLKHGPGDFWRSLGCVPVPRMWAFAFAGPVLAISLGLLGNALHAPNLPAPFEGLITGTASLVLLGTFAVLFGPFAEELAFRGLLMPRLVQTLGAIGGVFAAALLFALLHGFEYHWAWQHVLLILLAGLCFGWARYRTGSTLASTTLHATYNLTFFGILLLQRNSW